MYVVISILLTIFICHYFIKKINFRELDTFPGPPQLPIFGSLFSIGSDSVEQFENLCALTKKYGDVYRMWIGPFNPILVVTNPKIIQQILTSAVHIKKSPLYHIFLPLLGDGLLSNMGGDRKWQAHRRLLNPNFNYKTFPKHVDHFDNAANVLIKKLGEHTGRSSFDVFPYLGNFTLDVTCESILGLSLDTQNELPHVYLDNMQEFEKDFMKRRFSLIGRVESLYQLSPASKPFYDRVAILRKFADDVIKQKRKQWDARKEETGSNKFDSENQLTVLETMFESQDRNKLSMEEILDEVNTFICTGHHSSSSTLGFALYELAKRPDLQDKILEEFNSYVGFNKDAKITHSNLRNLKHTDCIIKETLRLHATVPIIERGIQDDLEIDGRKIPRGTSILIFIYGLHTSEKHYDEPQKFMPERFLTENSVGRDPNTFIPFSTGFRNCIAQKFAMLQLKTALLKIVKNFVIYPAIPEERLKVCASSILRSNNGLRIRLEPRV